MQLRMRRPLTATAVIALTALAIPSALADPGADADQSGTAQSGAPQSGGSQSATAAAPEPGTAETEAEATTEATPSREARSTALAAAADDTVELNLYNLTDFHGHIEQATNKDKIVTEAGAASLACWVNRARETDTDSTFVLLGDNIGASPYTSGILYDNPTIEALNLMHPLASTLGNHELDLTIKEFEKRVTGGTIKDTDTHYVAPNFPYMAANVTGTTALKDPGYEIWTSGSGVKVAFIAGIAQDVPLKLMPGAADGLTFNDPISTTNALAKELKESRQADVVIAMIDDDARNTAPKMGRYVDGLMGGDTHVTYDLDKVTGADGNTLSATASGAFGDAISNLRITYDKTTGTVTDSSVEITRAPDIAKCGSDPAVADVVSTATASAKEAGDRVVASGIQGEFRRGIFTDDKGVTQAGGNRGTESTLGDLIADAMRAGVIVDGKPADIGIINAGGIRADLVPTDGTLTYTNTFAVMPFSNQIGYVKVTGTDFKDALEQQWKELSQQNSRPMLKLGLSSNVSYTYDWTRPAGDRITSVTVNGEPLDPTRTYTIGSVTFLLAGGDDFSALTRGGGVTDLGSLDRDQFNEYLGENASALAPRTLKASVGVSAPTEFEVVTQDVVDQCGAELGVTEAQTSFKVKLRGLSFTEGPGKASTAQVAIGDTTSEATVENSIVDSPTEPEHQGEVTTDGTGRATVTVDATALTAGTQPLTVSTDLGTLVSADAGLSVKVSVATCGTPTPEPSDNPSTGPSPKPSTHTPGTSPTSSAVKPGGLAQTGADALVLGALALLLLAGGGAAVVVARRRNRTPKD